MANKVREVGDFGGAGDFQSVAEIVPERDALFGAGLHQAEEGVAAIAARV